MNNDSGTLFDEAWRVRVERSASLYLWWDEMLKEVREIPEYD